MEITVIHYILAFLGFAIYVTIGMSKAKATHKKDFDYMVWLQGNMLALVTSALSVVILMMLTPEIFQLNILPEKLSGLLKVASVVFGFFNLTLFKMVIDIANPKKLRKRK